jgi:hypothetical protein
MAAFGIPGDSADLFQETPANPLRRDLCPVRVDLASTDVHRGEQ